MSILLCYDGSPSANEAILAAHMILCDNRTILGDNKITLLHAWTPPVAILSDAFGDSQAGSDPSTEELTRLDLARAGEIAQEGHELAKLLGLFVTPRVECAASSVWRTILDVAEEIACDLIVIGTRSRTAVQPGVLGSVSGEVVRHSTKPVLVVPTPDRPHAGETRLASAGMSVNHRH